MNLNKPPIPDCNRKPLLRAKGEEVWHGLTPTRFACPLPPGSPTPPVRAKAYRATKDRDAVAVDVKGTPQLAGKFSPRRD